MKLISLLFFVEIFLARRTYRDHPYFKQKDYSQYHKFEKGHIYSQANGHARGDQGSSSVYSSKKKSSAASKGSDYSNARTKHHSFNQMAEYQYDNNGWGHQVEQKTRAQEQSKNNANAEAYGNTTTKALSAKDNTESFAKGDEFSRSEANFNSDQKKQQQTKENKIGGFDHRQIHHNNNIDHKISTNSNGKSHGQGFSHSKGNKKGSHQNNKGNHSTNSHATYQGHHLKNSKKHMKKIHDHFWGNKSWGSNKDDKYWDNFY